MLPLGARAGVRLAIRGGFGYNGAKLRGKEPTVSMTSIKIRLTMMTDDVKRFAAIVGEYPYDIDLCSGRYVVDAKSLLGIFSVDLSRPIEMRIYSDDCGDLLERIRPYSIEEEAEK